MEFLINVPKEKFDDFIKKHERGHILQTSEWGEFKSKSEWEHHLLGLHENDKLVAASMFLSREVPVIKKKIVYAPRGIVVDYSRKDVLKEFTERIKVFFDDAIFIKIDPDILLRERDIDGNIIDGGVDNTDIINQIKDVGFKHRKLELNFGSTQPRFSFRLDIDKSEEDLLAQFHHKTRYNIRLAKRRGVEIVEGNREDLKVFSKIMKVTGERDGFITRPLSYFEEMYDTLYPSGKLKLFLAKINPDNEIDRENENLEKIKQEVRRLKSSMEKSTYLSKKDEVSVEIDKCMERAKKLEERIESLSEAKRENPDGIVVAGTILVLNGDKSWYLYGASDNEHRNLMPNHLLQWEMIRYAKSKGCKMYDFRGISGDLSKDNPLYGLYRFKRGFNGDFTEFIGEFDYVISPFWYFIWDKGLPVFKKIRRIVLRK